MYLYQRVAGQSLPDVDIPQGELLLFLCNFVLHDTSKLDKWRVTYYVSILKKLGKKAISKVVRLSLS